MKNGVLSNFTRSHISSDRVRSGYEINAHDVHTTAKQVISRRRKNENEYKMSKTENCTCKACKNTVFHCQICKFVGFLLPSSSWLLIIKLSNKTPHAALSMW